MARRYELTDQQWRLIEECFPPANVTGRRRSGASWRDLPDRYGPWQTGYHWFNSWSKDSTLDRILEKLQVKLE